jgi:hypothetical protein
MNPAPNANGSLHHSGKLKGGIQGTTGHDQPCYLPAIAFLSVCFNNGGQVLLGEGINNGGCSKFLSGIKAHIKGSIELEAEATAGVGELQGGKTEIKQDAVDGVKV